jgi:NADH-quinone oxidoreductase subunit N
MRSLFFIAPTAFLCLGSIFVLTFGLWISSSSFLVTSSVLTLLGAGGGLLAMIGKPTQDAFGGMVVFDPFGLFFSLFIIFSVLICVVLSSNSLEIKKDRKAEYFSILLALCSGLILMGISNHFLMIYLAIETVSILSYTLAGFNRERGSSVEASLKYVVYGSLASAIMVYGMSMIFGVTGSLELTTLREFVQTTAPEQIPTVLWVAVLFVFAGIGYKISAAPMHMWTPDVYEGAPTPVSALFSVAPKAAGFALLLRFFLTVFSVPLDPSSSLVSLTSPTEVSFHVIGPFAWTKFLLISSIFTMFMGNLAALGQVSVKRILAYSSIAHAGYMLMGATTQTSAGIQGIIFYLSVYCLMNMGAFWIASIVNDSLGGDELRHFRGLGYRSPFLGIVMTVFLFSLVGIPPFAGFIGKLYLFSAVIGREMYGYAVVAALNSVISLYYYAKIIRAMYFDAPEISMTTKPSILVPRIAMIFLGLLALPNIVFGLYWEPLIKMAKAATYFFSGRS